MKRLFITVLIITSIIITGLVPVHAQNFCHEETLSESMNPFFIPPQGYYASASQGMCIADDTIIYTRYSSDDEKTVYVILDIMTGKELGHQEFDTLHSNSLTYNPAKQELVCVSKSRAFIFSYIDKHLELVDTVYMNHNCPKIAYNRSDGYYYLGTSSKVFRTLDFHNLEPVFSVPQLGINQGMGCDGVYLYIPWYTVGNNTVCVYDTSGTLVHKYSLVSDQYREIEDIDFVGDRMYLNIQNSPENGIYYIDPEHQYGEWKTELEPTCSNEGARIRQCLNCDDFQYESIPATGQHVAGKWEYSKKPTCTEEGSRFRTCTTCGKVLEEETVQPLGHNFTKWETVKEPDALNEGLEKRHCDRCDYKEDRAVEKLPAWIKTPYPDMPAELEKGSIEYQYEMEKGDKLVSAYSDNAEVASCEGTTITPLKCGHAVIHLRTEAGAEAEINVDVFSTTPSKRGLDEFRISTKEPTKKIKKENVKENVLKRNY